MTSDASGEGIALLLARKQEWHRQQARKSLEEKVRILLELQRHELPLLARQRPLRPWESRGTSRPDAGNHRRRRQAQFDNSVFHLAAGVCTGVRSAASVLLDDDGREAKVAGPRKTRRPLGRENY